MASPEAINIFSKLSLFLLVIIENEINNERMYIDLFMGTEISS